MSDQHITIHELPDFWQEKVRALRAENRSLRARLRQFNGCQSDLPNDWAKRLEELRRENARYRTQRNDARAEAESLRAELEARSK